MFLSERLHWSDRLIILIFVDFFGAAMMIVGTIYLGFGWWLVDLPWLESTQSAITLLVVGFIAMVWSAPKIFVHLIYQLSGDVTPGSPKPPPPPRPVEKNVEYQGVDMDDGDDDDEPRPPPRRR